MTIGVKEVKDIMKMVNHDANEASETIKIIQKALGNRLAQYQAI